MYVIGKTGTGKSTLLETLVREDILPGDGLAILDPHGDLVDKILISVPDHRRNDLIYFNPSDRASPLTFNPLILEIAFALAVAAQTMYGLKEEIEPPQILGCLSSLYFLIRGLDNFKKDFDTRAKVKSGKAFDYSRSPLDMPQIDPL